MNTSIRRTTIATHVLRAMAAAQRGGHRVTLDALTERLCVRRADVRDTLSSLHREGHVDAQRMRLTLSGFALGTALLECALEKLRPSKGAASRVAA